jgi:hypothetical protein
MSMIRPWILTVLSLSTVASYVKAQMRPKSRPERTLRHAGVLS